MSTTALLTVGEFLDLPAKPGYKLELKKGVVVEIPGANLEHEIVKSRVMLSFGNYLVANPVGLPLAECLFILDEYTSYIPDVSFVLAGRLRQANPTERFRGAPDLAVEVVSSESAADLEQKVRDYLRFGTRLVWVIYPRQRVVHVHAGKESIRVLDESQALDGGDVLPGLQVPVRDLLQSA